MTIQGFQHAFNLTDLDSKFRQALKCPPKQIGLRHGAVVLRSMISLEEVRCPYVSSVSVCFMRLEYIGNALPMLLQCGLQPPLENARQRYIYIYLECSCHVV